MRVLLLNLLRTVLVAVLLVPFPFVLEKRPDGTWSFGPQPALADGDDDDDDDDERDDNDEDDDDDDRDDDEDDDRDDDEDDDDDDDRDDDEEDDDRDDDEEDRDDDRDDDEDRAETEDDDDRQDRDEELRQVSPGGNDDDRRTTGTERRPVDGSDARSGTIENLHLRYPNGWDERIYNNRYILIDPQGRQVTNRQATIEDLIRMRDAAGL